MFEEHFRIETFSAIQKVCGHQKFEGDFGLDRKFGDFGRAVGVADLVGEVHADLLQHVGRDLAEVDLIKNKIKLIQYKTKRAVEKL